MKKHVTYLTLSLFCVIIITGQNSIVLANKSDAENSIQKAKVNIEISYYLIKRISNFEVDVSKHVSDLNNAIKLLEESENELNKNNYDQSITYSEQSISITEEMNANLNHLLLKLSNSRFLKQAINSVKVISLLIAATIITYYLWKIFKEKYIERMMEMKPVVIVDEA